MIVAGQQTREPIPITGLEAYLSEVIRQEENLEKAQTGTVLGVKLEVMDDAEDQVTLRQSEPLATLDVESLKAKLERFVNVLEQWRGITADYRPVAEEPRMGSGFIQI